MKNVAGSKVQACNTALLQSSGNRFKKNNILWKYLSYSTNFRTDNYLHNLIKLYSKMGHINNIFRG